MTRQLRLLLVEDEAVLRGLVAQFLRSAGFEVFEACDGPDGVDRFDCDGPFDLALVDLNLPGFSGVEVCRRLRLASPDQKILVCSAAVTSESEQSLRAIGVQNFLTKPYHPEALLSHIRREVQPRPAPRESVAAST